MGGAKKQFVLRKLSLGYISRIVDNATYVFVMNWQASNNAF